MKQLFLYILILIQCVCYAQNESVNLSDHVRSNNLEEVKANYSSQEIIKIDLKSGLRPLQLAAKMGHSDIVAYIVSQEAFLETGIYVERNEKPAMIHAIEHGQLEVIKVLLDSGTRDANNRWMGKTYLFHAYDLSADKAVIDLLVEYGADKALAIRDKKQTSKIEKVNTVAENLTAELLKDFQFDKYQSIDVFNVNLMAAQMLYEFEEKYKGDDNAIKNERAVIMEYRNKKLFRLLDANQRVTFNQLFK